MVRHVLKIIFKTISSFFTIIAIVIPILQFSGVATYKKLLEKLGVETEELRIIIAITSAVVAFLIILSVIYDERQKIQKRRIAGDSIHYFLHHLRNIIFNMKTAYHRYKTHEGFYEYVHAICYELCEFIEEFIKNLCGKDFSVCIKMIDLDSNSQINQLKTAEVYTLCRAGKDREKRSAEWEPVKIVDNTDFESIMRNGLYSVSRSVFACSNLAMLKFFRFILGQAYNNTTNKFLERYKSTIVVPIRIKQIFVDKRKRDAVCQTIAFLCIDHRHPISRALKDELVGYMKGFGDILYALFDEVMIQDQKIADYEKKMEKLEPKIQSHQTFQFS